MGPVVAVCAVAGVGVVLVAGVVRGWAGGGAGVGAQGGEDPDGGAAVVVEVVDLGSSRPAGQRGLVGPGGDEHLFADAGEQLEGAVGLGPPGVFQRGLVAAHARAAPAGEHQSVEGRGAHGAPR